MSADASDIISLSLCNSRVVLLWVGVRQDETIWFNIQTVYETYDMILKLIANSGFQPNLEILIPDSQTF